MSALCRGVYAYEPNSDICNFLQKGARSNVEVSLVALSDKSGSATLRIPRIDGTLNPGRASLSHCEVSGKENEFSEFLVRTKRLDDENLECVGFIKIDVEGHELAVLKGATELIRRELPVMLIEIEQRHLSVLMGEVINYIQQLGYEGAFLFNEELRAITGFNMELHQKTVDGEPMPDCYINNFIFYPKCSSYNRI